MLKNIVGLNSKMVESLKVLILFLCIGCSDFNKKYPKGINYIHEGLEYNFITKANHRGFFLEPNIIQVKENRDYLLFVQRIDVERLRRRIAREVFPNTKNLDSINFIPYADSIIKNSPHLNLQIKYEKAYWILNLKKDSLIGPLDDKNLVESRYGFKVD